MYSIIKYSFILSCFLFCLLKNRPLQNYPQMRLLICALFFTACADYFLIFTNYFLTGILLFCLVQLCYRLFLGGNWNSLLKNSLFALLFLLPLAYFSEIILLPAAIYIGFLYANISLAKHQKNFSLLTAFTLMFLCDIHVGFANLPQYLNLLPAAWSSFSSNILWFFYLPSQFMISRQTAGNPPPL